MLKTKKSAGSFFGQIDGRTLTMIGVLFVIWIGFTATTCQGGTDFAGSFMSLRNLSNLTRQMSIVGIMGISMVLVIVTGGIDLSAGSVMGFIGCCAAALQVLSHWNTPTVILVSLAIGLAVGLLEGCLIAYAGLAPFIVTLGGQLLFKGGILAVTGGKTIAPMKESFLYFGNSYIGIGLGWGIAIFVIVAKVLLMLNKRKQQVKHGNTLNPMSHDVIMWAIFSVIIFVVVALLNSYKGIPVPVMLMMVLVVIFTFIAEKTTFGRAIYAIGGNVAAANFAGINVKKNLAIVYTLNGFMCAVAGMVLTARLNAGTSYAGLNYELDAIAAAVIGGTSIDKGGIGKVAGAILGALIMASIDNGMSMMNLDSYYQYMVKGIILVLAVWFDVRSHRK